MNLLTLIGNFSFMLCLVLEKYKGKKKNIKDNDFPMSNFIIENTKKSKI